MRPGRSLPNLSAYEKRAIVGQYHSSEELYPAEALAFERYAGQFSGRVLDIGVGGGRTTRVLLKRSRHYIGLDFSRTMIAAAVHDFPRADLRVLDMREVPQEFVGEQFDAILISFNSIDYISWEERCELIRALPTLLAPGGVFVFSSHDLEVANLQRGFHLRPDLRASLQTAYNPLSLLRLALRTPPWLVRALRNRQRNRKLEKTFDDYAYINDAAEDYGVVTLYVSRERQVRELNANGLTRVQVLHPSLEQGTAYFNYFVCQV